MARPPCSVENCGKKSHANKLCKSHYERLRRHGDPNAGRTNNGDPLRFIHNIAATNNSAECLMWPYSRDQNGYGKLVIDGRLIGAHRYVCILAHGNAPTPDHQAAHSCGNGHLGCVSKRHLSWKSILENEADKIIHGTICRGERHWNSKLDESQVREIISLKGVGTLDEIARKFGVSITQIWSIQRGKRWSWIGAKRDTE